MHHAVILDTHGIQKGDFGMYLEESSLGISYLQNLVNSMEVISEEGYLQELDIFLFIDN